MRIYKTTVYHRDNGLRCFWDSSKREAERSLAKLLKDEEWAGPSHVEMVIVPSTKREMLGFLNAVAYADNG